MAAKYRILERRKDGGELLGYWHNQATIRPRDPAKALVLQQWQYDEIWAKHLETAELGGLIPCTPGNELAVEMQEEDGGPWSEIASHAARTNRLIEFEMGEPTKEDPRSPKGAYPAHDRTDPARNEQRPDDTDERRND